MSRQTYIIINIVSICVFTLLTGCFTGVESTPKITYSDVKKEHIHVTDEQLYLEDVTPQPPSQWQRGKRFYVTDSRISLILSSDVPIDADKLVGQDLLYLCTVPMTSVTGDDVAAIDFITEDGTKVRYKTQISYSELAEKAYLDVPYAIERDIIDTVSDKAKGQIYYITTPMWYTEEGEQPVNGLRHVEVQIDDVQPGNANYPLKMVFHQTGSDKKYSVFMTIGSRRTSTRNFDTLFAFENPRKRYPQIPEEDWQLIIHSKVKIGMTMDECRLALGAPNTRGQRQTTAGMVEYWSYAEGIYLLFDEGVLSSYRH